jgi:hypothetical protein
LRESTDGGGGTAPGKAPSQLPIISWRDAYRHYGENVAVRGTIRRVVEIPGILYYLEFNPAGEEFQPEIQPSIAIHKPDFGKFPKKMLDDYVGKEVLATGRVDRLGFRLRIRLRDPSQIRFSAAGVHPLSSKLKTAPASKRRGRGSVKTTGSAAR